MSTASVSKRRQQLLINVLKHAARFGEPAALAAALDVVVRVHDPETDQPTYVNVRGLLPIHVRAV